jgi:hypothetical protein
MRSGYECVGDDGVNDSIFMEGGFGISEYKI